MVKKIIKTALAIVIGAWSLTSCSDDEAPVLVSHGRVADTDVSVSVRFNLPSSKAGDPGTGHPEFDQGWSTLAFYFVYSDGTVLTRTVSHEQFEAVNTFSIYEGDVAAYVAAFPANHLVSTGVLSRDAVLNMTTTPADAAIGVDGMREYMLGFFSGISTEMHVSPERENAMAVRLDRLVSKVDLQWDVQPGIDGGAFVSAAMSGITFVGYASGFVFPTAATSTLAAQPADLVTLDGNVSERNGRAYFYTFPGSGCGFRFDVAFDGVDDATVRKTYAATFDDAVTGDVWHKVNLTVRGSTVGETADPVSITLTPNKQ